MDATAFVAVIGRRLMPTSSLALAIYREHLRTSMVVVLPIERHSFYAKIIDETLWLNGIIDLHDRLLQKIPPSTVIASVDATINRSVLQNKYASMSVYKTSLWTTDHNSRAFMFVSLKFAEKTKDYGNRHM